ncbi:hypothetical protein SISNIDRAFT_472522 [Sistotremastrum niveocremeum HHB9708]|uniref:RNA-binding domain-containing protein n=1 Tax=Sistotremastrum niveocremeum HHB9708 TaxID=1314777 RepID=A0A164Z3L1_9AGAM|nr:hypothetical protein SISNIDRAFT_472522 [Sistotremastrum niveocremeum HHB9708]
MNQVFAGNLAYDTTDQDLKAFFAPVANEIISAQVILRGTRSAGYGFVSLTTLEAAQKAVEALDKKELSGRNIIIEIAKPTEQKDKERSEKRAKRRAGRTRSRAPPGEVTEAEASADADAEPAKPAGDEPASSGDAEKLKKKKKPTRKPKAKKAPTAPDAAPAEGTAPTESAEPATSDAAASKRQPRPKRERRPSRPAGEEPVGEPSKNMLFVANLGFNVDDAGLAELFTAAGITVVSAHIVRRRWGHPRKSKGYGFVDVGNEEEQKKALAAFEGKEVGGREIAVKVAVNTPKDEEDTEAKEAGARQLELDARQEALSKSLFERAKDEEESGAKPGNKALSMMMKMGFKPGQSLGKTDDVVEEPASSSTTTDPATATRSSTTAPHLIEPLPIKMWAGRTGLGRGKRPLSPGATDRIAKVAKLSEENEKSAYLNRAREDFENRRAEGRLINATRTCLTLDETRDVKFNVLWLNPSQIDSFPEGLLDELQKDPSIQLGRDAKQHKLRMKLQSLQSLPDLGDADEVETNRRPASKQTIFSEEDLEDAKEFCQLPVRLRLAHTVEYLRHTHCYCFWCGTQYNDTTDMEAQCPGPTEEEHD